MRHRAGVLVTTSLATSLAALACGSSGSSVDSDRSPDAEADVQAVPDGPTPELDAGPDTADAADAADAKSDVIAPGGPFCAPLAPAPKFCDDFDDGDLTNGWTAFAVAPGAVFELDPSSSTSAPASFHLLAKASAAAASNNVLLRTTMFGAVTHAKVAFAVHLPSVTFSKGAVAIAQLYVTLTDVYTLYLRGPDDAANMPMLEEVVGGMITRHMLTKLPPAGAWTRVTLDLDLSGGKATVAFDAQKALDAEPITVFAGSEATLRLGAIVDGPSDAFEARFDDVIVDF